AAPGGVEDAIGIQHPAIGQRGLERAIGLLVDAADVAVEPQVQALLLHLVAQVHAQAFIEAAQEEVAAIQQRGIGPQAMEDGGEFDGDVATTHHQDTLGQLLQVEGLVGTDGMFDARDVRQLRPAARGDQDMARAVAAPIHLDTRAAQQACMAFQQRHPAVDQQFSVDPIEALDLAILVLDQRGPVELRLATAPAVTLGLANLFLEMRSIDQQLLRHAPAVDAGAAQVTTLGNCHSRSVTDNNKYPPNATMTSAKDQKVVTVGRSVDTRIRLPAYLSTPKLGSIAGRPTMQPTLTHIALHVPDLEACMAFYAEFCGLRLIHERPGKGSRIVWMAEPGREQEFVIVMMPGGTDRNL